jgi:hypothetical protein
MWGDWSTSRRGRFTPGEDPVAIVYDARRAPDRSGRVRKLAPPPPPKEFDPLAVQRVASLYTD